MNWMNRLLKQTDLLVGFGVLLIIGMLILPLPELVLDAGLTIAIAMSVVILMASINVSDPLEFSVFPSLLLITTLFRLSLSIAATKLILGTGSAGKVIETFGKFVMGGDPVVGFVAFLIIIIVQFLVITNGSGRVAEVVARFTLDAMPGKQLAIDADLAAGLIDENGARERRKQIKREADFYGAMDGASKFVKGDATASMLMIAVNLIGGFIIGWMHGAGDPMQILSTYSLLSVGEGLVSQIPALMISTASGLMVTRAGQDRSMGSEAAGQLLGQPKSIGFAGIAVGALAFVPGFPTFIFLGVSAVLLTMSQVIGKSPGMAKQLSQGKSQAAQPAAAAAKQETKAPVGPEAVLPLLAVDPIEIEIGYGLTSLADPKVGGDLSDRITATRRQIALDLGFVMPTVRIRDSVHLESDQYVLKIRGEQVAEGKAMPGNLLAVNSGAITHAVPGTPARDPVFNLDALWITTANKENAEHAGYTVIEPGAVISTHLAEIVKNYAAELLSRQDVQQLIENAKQHNSAVVNELVPDVLQLGDIQKVLQHLLRERVSIRDMVTILETMADYGGRLKDPDQLGEVVRSAISRTITRQHLDAEQKLYCISFEPAYERSLAEAVVLTSVGAQLQLDFAGQRQLVDKLKTEVEAAATRGYQPVLICGTTLRLPLRRILEKSLPSLAVMAFSEVAPRAEVEFVGQVRAA